MAKDDKAKNAVDVTEERRAKLDAIAHDSTEYVTDLQRGCVFIIRRDRFAIDEDVTRISFADMATLAQTLITVLLAVDRGVRSGGLETARIVAPGNARRDIQ